jgi:hypothetical protein
MKELALSRNASRRADHTQVNYIALCTLKVWRLADKNVVLLALLRTNGIKEATANKTILLLTDQRDHSAYVNETLTASDALPAEARDEKVEPETLAATDALPAEARDGVEPGTLAASGACFPEARDAVVEPDTLSGVDACPVKERENEGIREILDGIGDSSDFVLFLLEVVAAITAARPAPIKRASRFLVLVSLAGGCFWSTLWS